MRLAALLRLRSTCRRSLVKQSECLRLRNGKAKGEPSHLSQQLAARRAAGF